MIRINRNIGAKVIVSKVLVDINSKDGWVYRKKVSGTIVELGDRRRYYHWCNGNHTNVTKCNIERDYLDKYAVKLDDGIVDIEGNNIIVYLRHTIKFVERTEILPKPVTEKAYLKAKQTIERYERENDTKNI